MVLVPPEVRATLAGPREAARPEGDTIEARETVPLKPFTLATVIDVVLGRPVMTFTLDGAEMVKSTRLTVTVTEWESDPLVPCIVTE